MQAIEAISGLFLGQRDSLLLLQRAPQRTHYPNKWDIMGGNIQPGETPEEVLHRDANEKLHITNVQIFQTAVTTYPISDKLIIQRHIFVSSGDYSDIRTDSSKYQEHGWFSTHKILKMDLTEGAKTVIYEIGLK